ncbi:MAG: transposase, partial [Treponema sp.]|nr:transposase [Treponema sp.]
AATSLEGTVSAVQIAVQIMELYRMRWEIEQAFKGLKSLFHYNEIPLKLEATAGVWFYGKLLLAALCERIVNKGHFSPAYLMFVQIPNGRDCRPCGVF